MSKSQAIFQKARISLATVVVAVVASGCVSPMALNKTSGVLDLSTKSIAVFTLRVENQYKPNGTLAASCVDIVSTATGAARRFQVDPLIPYSAGRMISVGVEPGTYTLKDVMGSYIPAWGRFCFPVNATFTVPMRSVTYVGHVDMVMRKNKGHEPLSGPKFPLVDQAWAGFSTCTFDITVSDRSETDIPLFTRTYPILRGVQIGKAIMQK